MFEKFFWGSRRWEPLTVGTINLVPEGTKTVPEGTKTIPKGIEMVSEGITMVAEAIKRTQVYQK